MEKVIHGYRNVYRVGLSEYAYTRWFETAEVRDAAMETRQARMVSAGLDSTVGGPWTLHQISTSVAADSVVENACSTRML